MWSIMDEQNGIILESGKNSSSKSEALEGAWGFWVDIDGQELSEKELEKLYYEKEDWLNSIGLVPFEHEEPI